MKLIITDIESPKFNVQDEHKVISPKCKIHRCIGCFSCWTKTPGECIIHDSYEKVSLYMSKCTELIIVSKCSYGSVSSFIKAVQDRNISYIHPCFVIKNGEMHHKRRYDNTITVSAVFYGENISEREKATARKFISANADNYNANVGYIKFTENPEQVQEVAL